MAVERGNGARITGISSMAMRRVLTELGDAYERQSGQRVTVESVGGVDAARRIQAGEAFDFVVLAAGAIDRLAISGRIDPESRCDLARSGIAIAVTAGAPRVDVGSESSVRRAILDARRVGYSTGPSGTHLACLLERWGVAELVAPRLVQAPPGVPVGALLARGDVELGFQQLCELLHVPGIEVLGPLPPEIQATTVFSAAVCTASTRRAPATAFLTFLASPAGDAAKRRHGMESA